MTSPKMSMADFVESLRAAVEENNGKDLFICRECRRQYVGEMPAGHYPCDQDTTHLNDLMKMWGI